MIRDRDGLDGDAFNIALIVSTTDLKVSFLSPIGAPTVFDDPILLTRLGVGAVAHDHHHVISDRKRIELGVTFGVSIDSGFVGKEVVVGLK